jgi:Flp pilus assembly protein TadD
LDERGAVSLDLLGKALDSSGDPALAETVLRVAQRHYPTDVWVNYDLGVSLERLGRREEAIRYFFAARSVRPETAHQLAHALELRGDSDEAIAVFRDLIRLRPTSGQYGSCLGLLLIDLGRRNEAEPVLDAVIATSRAAMRLKSDDPYAHIWLSRALFGQGKLDEALAEVREAIRLDPGWGNAYSALGAVLRRKGDVPSAIVAYREAIRLNPNDVINHSDLGRALYLQRDVDGAIAAFREAIRLDPGYFIAHSNLGAALHRKGDVPAAIVACREAIRLNPNDADAHSNLGLALSAQGRLEEGLVELRRASELAPPGSPEAVGLPAQIREIEQMIALAARLPAVLKREDRPRDAAEAGTFSRLCRDQGRYAAAARLLADALAADPKLGEDRTTWYRYDAARAAALAGCGKSHDQPAPDEPARAALRQQALDWLKAEQAAWARYLDASSPGARTTVVERLRHWQQDSDLAGVREGEAQAGLPEPERAAWTALWAEVDALVAKARGERQ